MLGSWLGGPRSFAEAAGIDLGYPGKRLGLPAEGRNSVAGFSRRLVATTIDWIIASLMVSAFVPRPSQTEQLAHASTWRILFLPPAAFALLNIALVTTIGAGIGGRLLGIRVARLDGSNPPLWSAVVRTVLMLTAVLALVWDRDRRGIHDRMAGCVVVMR
jgi:uncharacterized RDD family membrane protein YckC